MKYTDFQIQLNQKNVLELIDCFPDSPIYDEVMEEYQTIVKTAREKMHPQAVYAFGEIPAQIATEFILAGTPALFVITTLGREISDWATDLFGKNLYLEGMLADAMADDCLFQASEALHPILKKVCSEQNLGVTQRVEAPTEIGMEAQKIALEVTNADKELGMRVTSGYMYEPVKSSCQIFLLKKNCKEFHMDHNCRSCPNRSCKMRTISAIKLEVKINGEVKEIFSNQGCSVLEMLRRENMYVPAICAGRGSCGKCRMQVLDGEIPISTADEKLFSKEQLKAGWRLACTAYPKADLKINFVDTMDEQMDILGSEIDKNAAEESNHAQIIGIDIGTTTIAMDLADLETGRVRGSYLTINRQRKFGADVISRILASTEGKKEELQKSICEDLMQGILKITKDGQIQPKKIVIAGNTTMIHLLMGYPCDTLGVYPFTPYHIEKIESTLGEIFSCCGIPDKLKNIPIYILPGISAFVGADIVSDLLVCSMAESEQVSMMIDLGTNGEMALGNQDKILVTSTAAGPAFEGGNIIHGTGSIPGAICGVKIENQKASVRTIQDKPAAGICGTGTIETIYELCKAEIIDETGLMEEPYEESGFPLAKNVEGEAICFYQKDVRELQLAKAAVRAGLETLLLRYGITAKEVDRVYLAGGFGYNVDVEKAIGIGLLPECFSGKIEVIGNGSLKGTILCAMEEEETLIHKIVDLSEEIALSTDKNFSELYMEHMYFQ